MGEFFSNFEEDDSSMLSEMILESGSSVALEKGDDFRIIPTFVPGPLPPMISEVEEEGIAAEASPSFDPELIWLKLIRDNKEVPEGECQGTQPVDEEEEEESDY
jgi:hypothetical protein